MRTALFSICLGVAASVAVADVSTALIVKNDRGGKLRDRLVELRELRQQSTPVELRGGVCFSTCTMYLGLPDTCVSPNTVFGFHGPSSYGKPLDPERFETASRIIASYYPRALRDWYMSDARHRIVRLSRVRGDQIIRLGVMQCAPEIKTPIEKDERNGR